MHPVSDKINNKQTILFISYSFLLFYKNKIFSLPKIFAKSSDEMYSTLLPFLGQENK